MSYDLKYQEDDFISYTIKQITRSSDVLYQMHLTNSSESFIYDIFLYIS